MSCKMRVKPHGFSGPCTHYIRGNKGECGFCNLSTRFRCEEAMKKLLPRMSMSAARTLLKCPWSYYLTYIRGYRVKPAHQPGPIKLGTIWDKWTGAGHADESLFEKYEIYPEDRAKLQAMWRIVQDMGIKFSDKHESQKQVMLPVGNNIVTGFADIDYGDGFGEIKLTKNPNYYLSIPYIHLQCGTYLAAEPKWKWAKMMVCRLPQLRMGKEKGKNAGESIETYENRIYSDISDRPSYYFIGLNASTGIFGKKFYRREFDIQSILDTYSGAFKMVRWFADSHYWPKNEVTCQFPTPCFFEQARSSGVLSPEIYYKAKGGHHESKPS